MTYVQPDWLHDYMVFLDPVKQTPICLGYDPMIYDAIPTRKMRVLSRSESSAIEFYLQVVEWTRNSKWSKPPK